LASTSVVLYIDNNSTYLKGKFEGDIYQDFKSYLGYLPEGSFWMVKRNSSKKEKWRMNWDGRVSTVCYNKKFCRCDMKKKGMHFPTGLLGAAVKFFKENNVDYRRVDIRKKTEKGSGYSMSEEFEIRDYQQEVIDKVVGTSQTKGIDRGIIKCATGGGKTGLACGIIAGVGVTPSIFYVPSIDILQQAKNEIERFVRYHGIPIEVGMVGGGHKDIKDITVMTIQTAVRSLGALYKKYDEEDVFVDDTNIDDMKSDIKELIRDSRLIICDEVQHWAAETCQVISDNSTSCQYRYGMSATPWRDMGDDILIDGCFGRCISDINASFLIREGYLVKPIIQFQRISNFRGHAKTGYANMYKKAIVENDYRNNIVRERAVQCRDNGRNVLVLVKQIAHGKILEKLIPDSIFLHGSTSKKKRSQHLDFMRNGTPHVTIASVIFDEGIDCRPLDTLILAGGGKSATRALQRIGRILRPHPAKEDAIAFDFYDQCKYLEKHSKKRRNIYRTEDEFVIQET
jgi:superfamily II DNA or RNA helicase